MWVDVSEARRRLEGAAARPVERSDERFNYPWAVGVARLRVAAGGPCEVAIKVFLRYFFEGCRPCRVAHGPAELRRGSRS